MIKKNWSNPEIMGIGLKATKEDELGDDAQVMTFYKCKYCTERFWTKRARNEHEKTCFSRPAVPGGELDGGFDIGVVPQS